MVLLSIIIPIYNSEPYIRKTLTSIFNQVEANTEECEVITINDGTQDHAMDIVYEFSRSHNNIKIIEQDNQGQAIARNKGIKIAQGKYIWCVDSDDWISSNSLNIVFSLIKNSNVDFFRVNMFYVTNDANLEESAYDGSILATGNGCDVFMYCLKHDTTDCAIARYILRREFLANENIDFYGGIFHEDEYLIKKAFLKAQKAVITSFKIYYYLQVPTSTIHNERYIEKRKNDLLLLFHLFYQMMPEYSGMSLKILNLMLYQHICKLSYFYDIYEDRSHSVDPILASLLPQFRKIVAKHIMFDKSLAGVIHRILFVISPSLFWKSRKHLW